MEEVRPKAHSTGLGSTIVICSMRLPRAALAQLYDCRFPEADVTKPRCDDNQDVVQAVPSVE
jgi:hypothetical protein